MFFIERASPLNAVLDGPQAHRHHLPSKMQCNVHGVNQGAQPERTCHISRQTKLRRRTKDDSIATRTGCGSQIEGRMRDQLCVSNKEAFGGRGVVGRSEGRRPHRANRSVRTYSERTNGGRPSRTNILVWPPNDALQRMKRGVDKLRSRPL